MIEEKIVIISEPHIYKPSAMYGGHQYARVFAQHGWKVIILSASFNWFRLLSITNNSDMLKSIALWQRGGKQVEPNIENFCLAHLIPSKFRYHKCVSIVSPFLFIPSPKLFLKSLGIQKVDLLWLNGNGDWLYRTVIPHDRLIVRIIDNYVGFRNSFDHHHPLMKKTLLAADAVVTCSHAAKKIYENIRGDIDVIPNGVDFNRFSQPELTDPEILQSIPHPRVIYVGAIASWFDLDLVIKIARDLSEYQFILVGPWLVDRPGENDMPSNIHIIGEVPYALIPSILANCDVGIVPFKHNELVESVSPIKIYEYLASGLPVVSTYWRELEIQSLPIMLARNDSEFINYLSNCVPCSESKKIELIEFSRKQTWEDRLIKILKKVDLEL